MSLYLKPSLNLTQTAVYSKDSVLSTDMAAMQRKTIADPGTLNDAASVKKHCSVIAYQKAREDIFTSRLLRACWSAVGLYPWIPSKGLNSSQASVPKPTESTPRSTEDPIFHTLKLHKDQNSSVQQLGARLMRDRQVLIKKTGKRIDALATELSFMSASYHKTKHCLEEFDEKHKRKKRKVAVDPDCMFANVAEVNRAIDKTAAAQEVEDDISPANLAAW
ncbi:hypothetical protein EDC01DRAFT_626461 [Geopyxis carbonaria]|nr:hypothetical protein EDC01DRAFT_626461 [Geopyxis carbonaria]